MTIINSFILNITLVTIKLFSYITRPSFFFLSKITCLIKVIFIEWSFGTWHQFFGKVLFFINQIGCLEQVLLFLKKECKIQSWSYWFGINRGILTCFLGGDAPLSIFLGMFSYWGSVCHVQQRDGHSGSLYSLNCQIDGAG